MTGYIGSSYADFKRKYESTKPIRGREGDIRPIGNRRRDWERIEFVPHGADAPPSYAAVLCNTRVVELFADGAVVLRCGRWATPSTADFIRNYSPFDCYKKGGSLWTAVRGIVYPIPTGDDGMRFIIGEGGVYVPDTAVTIKKRVIDRDKAKAARAPMLPFLKFAKTFLTLSDGWIMHETRKEVFGFVKNKGDNYPDYATTTKHMWVHDNKDAYERLAKGNERDFLVAMLMILQGVDRSLYGGENRVLAETFIYSWGYQDASGQTISYPQIQTFYDLRYSYDTLAREIEKIVRANVDIYKIVEVEPGHNAVYNAVE